MSGGQLKILYAEGIACPACTAQVTAIAFRSKLEDGALIERFCTVEGHGKELAKLWMWMKTTEQTPFLASVSEAHESDYACMRHRRGHAGDAVSNTRSTG